ncbi:PREDICTED: F-box/LRR-repeat protein 3-like [Populus euphratica]|uniref:F-box/LRR-repeat protein 3-like n=1 Tax=Populus euphratica TaxID=75702 RepID=A0AAJ6XJ91_POPEU|nr:PREDICTED: F-box/LRR-repeat protein 3-like [Populus euphratica]
MVSIPEKLFQKIQELDYRECLPSILQLQHLEDLVLEGCLGIDDDGLSTLQQSCKSLKVTANLAKCLQNFSGLQPVKLDGCVVKCSGIRAIWKLA